MGNPLHWPFSGSIKYFTLRAFQVIGYLTHEIADGAIPMTYMTGSSMHFCCKQLCSTLQERHSIEFKLRGRYLRGGVHEAADHSIPCSCTALVATGEPQDILL